MECCFCNIVEEEKQRVFEVREHVVIIFSNPRLMPGHMLVIPKRHVLHLSELSQEERSELFNTAIELQDKILEKVAPGCDIRQNNRPFLPESDVKVNHVHVHLQPRTFEDELFQKCQNNEVDVFQPLLDSEMEEMKKLLT